MIKNAILAAGTAPSGANQQPWHFAVVSNPEIKREIRKAAEKEERAFYQGRAPDEWLRALQPLGTDENKPFLEIVVTGYPSSDAEVPIISRYQLNQIATFD